MIVRFAVILVMVVGSLVAGSAVAAAKGGRPSVVAPADVVEGETYSVRVTVPRSWAATKVELQRRTEDVFGGVTWTKIRSWKVRGGKASRTVAVTADESTTDVLRAVVAYRDRKRSAASAASTVRYWHWYPVSRIVEYQQSGSSIDNLSFGMNGSVWNGWYSLGGGESRYTLGRNCNRFRGTVGLEDRSADGSAGVVTLSTIDSSNSVVPVYVSPQLSPGVAVPLELALDLPYRFSIAGKNTSAPVTTGGRTTTPAAYPAVGDAAFLCHFPEQG